MKFISISDTHGRHNKLNFNKCINVDCIIFSGDYGTIRSRAESDFYAFIEWLGNTHFKYKILIAGNNDHYLDTHKNEALQWINLNGIIYLEDTSININGINIHGSPWSPMYMNFPFMLSEDKLEYVYKTIPTNTNLLITHTPGYGILDKDSNRNKLGSKSLSARLPELKELEVHVFGHIHPSSGKLKRKKILFINSVMVLGRDLNVFEIKDRI